MKKKQELVQLPEAIIINRILHIRGKNVMVDRDLAELYGVNTKRLNQQVKRNIKRFPGDEFMFQLTAAEKSEVVTICDHLKNLKFSSYLPFVFTEHGTVMLASVLNSEKAIRMNIHVVKTFNKMREGLFSNKDILLKVQQLEGKSSDHDDHISTLFEYVKAIIHEKAKPRKKIGFKIKK